MLTFKSVKRVVKTRIKNYGAKVNVTILKYKVFAKETLMAIQQNIYISIITCLIELKWLISSS